MHGARAVITEAILIQLNVQNASAALSVPRLPEIKCLEQSIWCIKWIGILPRIDVQWWVKIESLPEAVWGGTVPGRLVLETRAVFHKPQCCTGVTSKVMRILVSRIWHQLGNSAWENTSLQATTLSDYVKHIGTRHCIHLNSRARDPEGYVLILSCNLLPRCYSDQDFIFLF